MHWVRRVVVALAVALLLTTAGSMVTGGAGPAAANPVCDAAGFIPGAKQGCEAVTGFVGDKAGDAIDSAVGGTFEKIVNSLLDSYQTVLTWALAWWIKLPTPELDNSNTLMQDVHDADYETPEGRHELRAYCQRIIARIDQREQTA